MDISKAEQLAKLVERKNRYESIIKAMESGYIDEWQFLNCHTGVTVDFSSDEWEEINEIFQRKLEEVLKKIEVF